MQLEQANRGDVKIKMGLEGPSSAGKTFSALLIANGLCNDWSKIAVIDTENRSSHLYSHLGNFNVLPLSAPFTTDRYIEAIGTCEKAGMQVVILDSISHEWIGPGGILETHALIPGNSFTNWTKVNPKHNTFVQYMLGCNVHIIATIRSKQDYILVEKNGKQIPEKVGMKPLTRSDMEFELTLVFKLNMENYAVATKDRTSLFLHKPEFILSRDTGKKILQWCKEGISAENQKPIEERINDCKSLDDLLQLFYENPTEDESILKAFTTKRTELEKSTETKQTNNQQSNNNGTYKRKTPQAQ